MVAELAIATAPRWRMEWVDPRHLAIDPTYHDAGRFDQKRADRIAEEFDEDALGIFTVSRRPDGRLVLLDANHRRSAAVKKGIARVLAKVFDGLSLEDEARIYRRLNETANLKNYAKFLAAVIERDPDALEITRIAAARGVRIASSGGQAGRPSTTRAIQVLYVAYRHDVLADTLDVLRAAWPDDQHALDSIPMQGVASFIFAYKSHPRFDLRRISHKLKEISASKFIADTKDLARLPGPDGRPSGGLTGGSTARITPLSWSAARRQVLVRFNNRHGDRTLPDLSDSDVRRLLLGQEIWR